MEAPSPKSVFVSASAGADLGTVANLLDASGLTFRSWVDLAPTMTASSPTAIVREAERHRALIVLIDSPQVPFANFMEVGVFLGRRRPVVLLLTDRSLRKQLPPVLAELPVIVIGDDLARTGRRLADLLRLGLRPASRRSQARTSSNIEPDEVQSIVGEPLDQGRTRDWADATEKAVAFALTALGAEVVPQGAGNKAGRLDLAIWVADIPNAWNPILVEVAARRPDIELRIELLRKFLHDYRNTLGILVTPDDHSAEWRVGSGVGVLIIGLQRLTRMQSTDFSLLLADGRNRLVHAV